MDDDWRLTGLRSLSRESYEKRTKRYVPQAGDIIFSREGSIGRSVILHEGNTCLGQRVMLLSCNEVLLFNKYCQVAAFLALCHGGDIVLQISERA